MRVSLGILGAALLVLSGCPGSLSNPELFDEEASCVGGTDNIPQLLRETCGGDTTCHGVNNPQLGLDLVSPDVASRLVGVTSTCMQRVLIEPGAPESSYVLTKVLEQPPCGLRMPLDGNLEPRDQACLQQWVQEVASQPPQPSVDAGGSDATIDGSAL